MSIELALTDLATALDRFTFAHLATIADGQRAHIVAASPVREGNTLRIAKPGRGTVHNLAQQPAATLLWPPTDPDDYSLLVEGPSVLDGDELIMTPTRAVLHRPARSPLLNPTTACGSDCIELSVPEGT